MSNAPNTDEGGRRAKRIKLSLPRSGPDGLARYRLSDEGMIEEPVGSRGPPKKSGSMSAGRGRGVRASTGNMEQADHAVNGMLADVFSPSTSKPPSVPVNGVATPPPSTGTARESLGGSDSNARRHVSGPGQFTPRALLKLEEDFEDIGVSADVLLRLRGDAISWWIAECVLRIAQYLDNPQAGRPTTISARPAHPPRSPDGKEVDFCCEMGGISHLLPCHLKKPPPAEEAFGFAGQRRDVLVSEHHASKGGINTIAYVGDIVMDKLVGESTVDEDEFKLLAGSEFLRQWLPKGQKRYKAPDPKVDPTKQPILLLKSFKKMAMNEEFVEALKKKYGWALANYQQLIGEKSPEPVTPVEPSPVPAFAQRAAASTPATNLAPAPIHVLTHLSMSAPPLKRGRNEPGTTSVSRRSTFKRASEAFPEPPSAMTDARMSRRPEFPLRELSDDECNRLTRSIADVRTLIDEIADPMRVVQSMAPPAKPTPAKLLSPSRKSGRSRKRTSRASDQINLLLDAASVTAMADDAKDEPSALTESLTEPISADFSLPLSSKLDGYIKTLVELVINNTIELYPSEVRLNARVKEVVQKRCAQLQRVFGDLDFRINTVVSATCGQAITDLYPFLSSKLPKQRPKRSTPGSPTGQLSLQLGIDIV